MEPLSAFKKEGNVNTIIIKSTLIAFIFMNINSAWAESLPVDSTKSVEPVTKRIDATAQAKAGKNLKTQPSVDSKFYSFVVKNSKNEEVKLSDYKGKVVLVVNVASRCGFTNQYEGLQKLYVDYKDKNFVVLGFPSNQFLSQEPGSNEEIQKFCKLTYGVDFPVFAKVDVNGDLAIPLYQWLTSLENFSGKISWNFNKFLINKNGQVVKRFGSRDKPESIEKDIKPLL